MDANRWKLTLYVSIGLGLILLVAQISVWPVFIRSVLMIIGGWLLAIAGLYQVRSYADDKGVIYYVLLIFFAVFWIAMLAVTLFWIITLLRRD
jgi:hypothetical protein